MYSSKWYMWTQPSDTRWRNIRDIVQIHPDDIRNESQDKHGHCDTGKHMLPKPRLDLSGILGPRPIGLSLGSWQTSLGLGSMSRYSAQILTCIPYALWQVISCVTNASACHQSPCQSQTPFITNSTHHWCQINITTLNYVCKLIIKSCILVEFHFADLNTPISRVWGSASRAHRPLLQGIVRRQCPRLRGTTWRNDGSSMRNCSRFEHHIRIINGEY